MPYAFFYIYRKILKHKFILFLFILSILFMPTFERMTQPQMHARHLLISVTHVTLSFWVFFLNQKEHVLKASDNCYKTVQSYTGQKHNLCLVTKQSRVLEQHTDNSPYICKQNFPGMFTCYQRFALNVKRLIIYPFFGVHVKSR